LKTEVSRGAVGEIVKGAIKGEAFNAIRFTQSVMIEAKEEEYDVQLAIRLRLNRRERCLESSSKRMNKLTTTSKKMDLRTKMGINGRVNSYDPKCLNPVAERAFHHEKDPG
jgi:hypothetical protein